MALTGPLYHIRPKAQKPKFTFLFQGLCFLIATLRTDWVRAHPFFSKKGILLQIQFKVNP